MAAKRMDLNKRTFLVLSGSSNPLGQSLALEFCRRLATGSVALILDEDQQQLRELEDLLQSELKTETIKVTTGKLNDSHSNGVQLMEQALKDHFKVVGDNQRFERSIMLHNEGLAASHVLLEPQSTEDWKEYVQQQLYAPVALSQRWLQSGYLAKVEKLAVNVTSSLMVRPLVHAGLLCSCKRARDMYFRAMAAEEHRFDVHVLSFSPGLMDSHRGQCDMNGNEITPAELVASKQLLQLPRIQPSQATLKLINILEEISFVSGHDVDYYDTFVL
ncbi:sepiapterin reductase [Drosophila gunungcola]|nr:sepiapterin reductase [Drosophila gunungcola]